MDVIPTFPDKYYEIITIPDVEILIFPTEHSGGDVN